MDEVKQKNISNYFSNLKRNSSMMFDGGVTGSARCNSSNNNFKRDKKSEIVRLGEFSNYTINKFFNFSASKDESCIKELKSGLKKLEINGGDFGKKLGTGGINFSNSAILNSNSSLTNNLNSNFLTASKIENYFLKKESKGTSFGDNNMENIFTNKNNENSTDLIDMQHDECLTKRVFSLDNFEIMGNSKKFDSAEIPSLASIHKIPPNQISNKRINYEDVKITTWVKYTTYSDLNGINENIFQNILKYLSFKDLTKISLVNKTLLNFYKNAVTSYPYFTQLDTSKIISKKEFQEMLKKAKNLKHIQKLIEIIKNDFGGEKHGAENFYSKVVVIMLLSDVEDLKYRGTLLETFKIKPKRDYHVNNFISNDSVISICSASKYTMRDLSLRGCFKLTNKIVLGGIELCSFLERLELSHNGQIDDEAIKKICDNCLNLKALNLSNLKLITEKAIKSISQLRQLEGLDLSDNYNIRGDSFVNLQNCPKINRLILNGIKLRDNDLIFTDYLRELRTLSIPGNQ